MDEERLHVLAGAVEQALREEHHYRSCRDLGHLGPVRVQRVVNGRTKWMAVLTARGLKLGDLKPAAFDPSPDWARWLASEG